MLAENRRFSYSLCLFIIQKNRQSHNESDLKIAFQIEHLKMLSKKLSELNISLKIIQAEEIDQENKKIN